MQFVQCWAVAGADGFTLLGIAILRKGAMVVLTDAIELQASILRVAHAPSESKSDWL